MHSRHDTIAALSTPVGNSALAVLRASGPACPALARELAGVDLPPRVATHADYRDVGGRLVDDVVFTLLVAPASYTGEDSLEISCHGNPFIAQRILEDLFARGCRPAEPGEFTRRAFLAGRMDLTQAEAVMDLIHARSERALAAAQQQLRGSLGRHMEQLGALITDALARVEAYIDFPDEDLPPEDRSLVLGLLGQARDESSKLLSTNNYSSILREGLKVVIVGAPNAGKSSLLNALVGRDRAIVSPTPGTTRDFIEDYVRCGDHLVRLTDTAGLNPEPGDIERLGMAKTLECVDEAQLLLVLLDPQAPSPEFPEPVLGQVRAGRVLLLSNKVDLGLPCPPPPPGMESLEIIQISAIKELGIEKIRDAVARFADRMTPSLGEDIIAVNARHADALQRVLRGLSAATERLAASGAAELVASDLRQSLDACGEISGRIDNERVLDRLFASFCIGK